MNAIAENARGLFRALGKLLPDQGRVARNNARRAVLRELKRVRAGMDRDFPVVPKAIVERARLKPELRVRRLARMGYAPLPMVESRSRLASLAVAGIRPIKAFSREIWVPTWVLSVTPDDVGTLKRLKRDVPARKRYLVEQTLRREP